MAVKKQDFTKILTDAAAVSVGAVGAEALGNKVIPNMKPEMAGAIKVAAGAVLPMLSPKTAFLPAVGNGIIASGAIQLAKAIAPGLVGAEAPAVEGIKGIGEAETVPIDDSEFSAWVSGTETPSNHNLADGKE